MSDTPAASSQYRSAKGALAHRIRETAVLDVEGPDRESFLQGQLTQDVRGLAPGRSRAAAALTPKGKLLFVATLVGMADRYRLLLPGASRQLALEHLRKYGAFQKVTISDATGELLHVGLYGPAAASLEPPGGSKIEGSGEFSAEWLVPRESRENAEAFLRREGSAAVGSEVAEILRVEAGRPKFGRDIDGAHLPDEAGLESAISRTKGCYVGQEIVARRQTYGRMNRRLVGFRFPSGPLPPGSALRRPEDAAGAAGVQAGNVSSSAVSPRFGPIGLGFAAHDLLPGDRLVALGEPGGDAVVSALPFP